MGLEVIGVSGLLANASSASFWVVTPWLLSLAVLGVLMWAFGRRRE